LTIQGATIINDAYNSNPEALKSMIQTLATRPLPEPNGRRILVAGEMLELGDHAQSLHAQCGKTAAEAGIDFIVGVRGNAQYLVAATSDAAVSGVETLFLPDAESAGQWLKENLIPGDLVLIKGSRGVRLERAIEVLKDESSV
jgi:UDP-N-acetylmuramoyl-tripeptide--D-alanyl-D-alanine ligase